MKSLWAISASVITITKLNNGGFAGSCLKKRAKDNYQALILGSVEQVNELINQGIIVAPKKVQNESRYHLDLENKI